VQAGQGSFFLDFHAIMSTMSDKSVEFLPYHAINEFMRPDYRQTVVRTALTALPQLPKHFREPIDRLTKKIVRVPGFRDGTQAPASLKIAPVASAFEKSPDLVAAILAAWAETHTTLRANVYQLLTERGWEVLPVEADRTRLPGFLTTWPNRDEDFDIMNTAYSEKFPAEPASTDDVSLMVVWLSGRLPIETGEEEDEESADSGGGDDHDHDGHDHN
jgi:hypothetical protein